MTQNHHCSVIAFSVTPPPHTHTFLKRYHSAVRIRGESMGTKPEDNQVFESSLDERRKGELAC